MKIIKRLAIVTILGVLLYLVVDYSSRIEPANPSLAAPFKLLPSSRHGGLKASDWSFWGASGVQGEDGRYHLFASRMGSQCGLKSWDFNSEIVRATADHPLGPYHMEEVVLPAMSHNPVIQKMADGQYRLYYIGVELSKDMKIRDCEAGQTRHMTREQKDNSTSWTCSINVRTASSLEGPWSEPELLTEGLRYPICATNPAPLLNPDQSVDLYYRAYRFLVTDDKSDKSRYHPYPQEWMYLATPDAETGAYSRFTPQPILQGQGEDAFVWRDDGGYHMVFNNKFNNKVEVGGYAFSADGKHFARGQALYGNQILFDDGQRETVRRRERPQIMWLDDNKGVLFQGVQANKESDQTYTLATPIGEWTEEELNILPATGGD